LSAWTLKVAGRPTDGRRRRQGPVDGGERRVGAATPARHDRAGRPAGPGRRRIDGQAGGIDDREMAAAEAQPGEDRLRHLHLRRDRTPVVRRLLVGHQHPDLDRAERDRRQPEVKADRSGVPDLERQDACRQAAHRGVGACCPAERADGGRTGTLAVDQQGRIFPAGARVGGEERADAPAELLGRGVA
jgi:hypothetical protein